MSPGLCLAVLAVAPILDSAEPEPAAPTPLNRSLQVDAFFQPAAPWTEADSRRDVLEEADFVVRGQSPGYDETPGAGGNSPLNLPMDPTGSWIPGPIQPIWPGAPMGGSPVAQAQGTAGGPVVMMMGANGPRPFRFGWQSSADIGVLPKEPTSGGLGHFGVFEANVELRYTTPLPWQHIFSFAPQFGYRGWDGPGTPPGSPNALPGSAYRIGADMRLTSPQMGPYTVELGFNPFLATDFEQSESSDAWGFDFHGAIFIRTSPRYLLVRGAAFWDRVDDRIIPYAGIVFTPHQYLEIRAVFPRPEISMFMGAPWGVPQWLYIAGEYHVETYEISNAVVREQLELEDWRLLGGIRSEQGGVSSFLEAGWVFGRDVDYINATPGFDISSGFIARFGIRY